jgi:uncharacterized protein YfaS (alpha-2-macroglobulin family)
LDFHSIRSGDPLVTHFLARFFAQLAAFLRAVFGEWHWNRPQWYLRTESRIARSPVGAQLSRGKAWTQANPRRAAIYLGSAIAVTALGSLSYHQYRTWLAAQPKPSYVSVRLERPNPTDPERKVVDKLTINFSASAARIESLNKELSAGVRISPPVPGRWTWTSDRQLVLAPKTEPDAKGNRFDWPAGQTYRVSFDRAFFPGHLKFEEYDHEFSTDIVHLSVPKSEFYIDPLHPSVKRVVATIQSNYPLDVEDFKKRVRFDYQSANDSVLKRPSRNIPFTVTFNPHFTAAYLESEPLSLAKEDQVMTITVDKGVRTPRGGNPAGDGVSAKVEVPGLYSAFKLKESEVIFARNERFEPEQVLTLETGVEAKSEEVLKSLEVLLLPADHQPPGARKVIRNYQWTSPSELTEEVRKASQPVALKVIPTETAYSSRHSFRIDLPVQRSIYLKLRKGIQGLGDYELEKDAERVVSIPDFTPELMFMSKGSILSLSGDKKLPLLARNVSDVSFEISRVIPAQSNHLITQMIQSGDFSKPSWYGEVENMLTERFTVDQKLHFKSRSETVYFSLDLAPYIKEGRGFFYVRAKSKNETPSDSDYHRSHGTSDDSRLILVTDLGLVAKKSAAGSTDVFVQDLRTGHPVTDAQIDVLGKNGISVLTVPSGSQGKGEIPELKDYKAEKEPVAFVVRRGGDTSYLPYELSERKIPISRFDVGGVYESSESNSLNAMVFSDRGIYRPGESVNLGLIVRSKRAKAGGAEAELPLVWSVVDPKGAEIHTEKFMTRPFGLKDLTFKTNETSPTGTYEARVSIIRKERNREYQDQLGSVSIKVEEFVPDQMRIQSTLEPYNATGWVQLGQGTSKLKAHVALTSLFGAAAENRKVKATLLVAPTVPKVPSQKDFIFANPNRVGPDGARVVTETLEEKVSSSKGEADYELDLAKYDGYFQVRLDTEGFQAEGGRGVHSTAAVMVSTLPYLVGYKPDGDLHFINRGAERKVKWVAVDSSHKTARADGLKLILIQRKYVSTLLRQGDGTYRYQSVKKDDEIKNEAFTIPKEMATLPLPTDTAGDFAYAVRDKDGKELGRVEFTVAGEANLARTLDRNAELQLILDKADYKPNDEIELQIKAPYAGAGLITIERDSVYAFKWFKTSSTSTVERIKVPEGLDGNAYVSVSMLRALDSKEIFMSPLSYGVQPFSISLDEHRTQVTLESPVKVKPGEALKIRYSADRPTQLVLYGVDEGILQVAKYHLPNPLEFFFRKRALQVQTFQLLDLLLPEFSVLQSVSASGGDEGFGALGKNLNPFRRKDQPPVTFWSGVLKADAEAKTYSVHVPEYFNGNIKIMAVASSPKGLGSTEVATISRGDFVIQPSTPLFVAPGDEFELGVNVSNQLEGADAASKLDVKVDATSQLQLVGAGQQSLDVPPGRERAVTFRVKALSQPGSASLKFTVSGGKKSVHLASSVSVRPAVPYITTAKMGMADKLPLEVAIDRPRLAEFRKTAFDVAPIPLVLGKSLATYLAEYPYGCTEQAVSKAFPGLVARNHPGFTATAGKIDERHSNLIAVLRTRQTGEGGFGLYDGWERSHVAASLYAIRYLAEASSRGLKVPQDMRNRALDFLRSSSELRRTDSLSAVRLFAESLYLQARNATVPSNDLNFLMEVLEKNFKNEWRQDLTAIHLAGTYALLKQDAKGDALIAGLKLGQARAFHDYDYYQDGLSRDAILIQVVATNFPARLKRLVDGDGFKSMIEPLQRGGFNTYSSAQVLLALDAMMVSADKSGFADAYLVKEKVADALRPLAMTKGLVAHGAPSGDATAVSVEAAPSAPAGLPTFYSLTQQGFDRDLPKAESKEGLELSRVYLSAQGDPIKPGSKIKLGDEITSLRARATGKQAFDHLLLVDLYPAGFDLIVESRVSAQPGSESRGESEGNPPEAMPEGESGGGDGGESEGAFYLPLPLHNWVIGSGLIPRAFAAEAPKLGDLTTSFVDFREDRVVVYGQGSPDIGEFRYRLKAVNRGKFVVPPAFGESMYDRSIHYRGTAGSIEVE